MRIKVVQLNLVIGVLTGAAVLAGCGVSASESGDEVTAVSTPVSQWAEDPCADPMVSARVDEALAAQTIGVENSLLVSPGDAREMVLGDDVVAQQAAAWAALTPEDRAFQQCLRFQEGEAPGPDG